VDADTQGLFKLAPRLLRMGNLLHRVRNHDLRVVCAANSVQYSNFIIRRRGRRILTTKSQPWIHEQDSSGATFVLSSRSAASWALFFSPGKYKDTAVTVTGLGIKLHSYFRSRTRSYYGSGRRCIVSANARLAWSGLEQPELQSPVAVSATRIFSPTGPLPHTDRGMVPPNNFTARFCSGRRQSWASQFDMCSGPCGLNCRATNVTSTSNLLVVPACSSTASAEMNQLVSA
jgi:hypothetical protein